MIGNIDYAAEQKRDLPEKRLKQKKSKFLPASFAQKRLWLLNQMEPDSAHYHPRPGMELHGNLNVEALNQAFYKRLKRHETLRTSFFLQNSEPAQLIHAPVDVKFSRLDLSGYKSASEKKGDTEQMEPSNTFYHSTLKARLGGSLNVLALLDSISVMDFCYHVARIKLMSLRVRRWRSLRRFRSWNRIWQKYSMSNIVEYVESVRWSRQNSINPGSGSEAARQVGEI